MPPGHPAGPPPSHGQPLGPPPGQPQGAPPGQPQGAPPGQPQGVPSGQPQGAPSGAALAAPHGPGGPGFPPSGQPMHSGPGGPPPRKKPVWLIPLSIVLAVALIGGGVWASVALVNNLFGGAQPESVLPRSSAVFAKLDLKPTGQQWASYAQFYERLPDTLKDEFESAEDDFGEELFEELFPNVELDYASEVEPWLGQRFGVAVWAGNEEPLYAIALAVEDEELAEETLTRIQSEDDTLFFEVVDGFAILTDSQDALNDRRFLVENEGTLEDNEDFADDISDIGRGIATAWIDYGAIVHNEVLAADADLEDLAELGQVTGRLVAVVRMESKYLEFQANLVNAALDGNTIFAESVPTGGITALHDLPDNSVIALGGDGLDAVAQAFWEANQGSIESSEDYEEFDSAMRELGVRLPADFHKLLGTKTAFGMTDLEGLDYFGYSDIPFELRLTGADSALWDELVSPMSTGFGPSPSVTTDGDTTVISMGSAGTGRLGDDPVFQETMSGLEKAHLALYMDLRVAAEMWEDARPNQWGGLGGALQFQENGSATLNLRWVPSPE
ncbi:acyltransferase [Thermobifida fusca]|nr:acyltransferase [Thermobifida sp.]PPS92260.1 acyltransferase [Thermobifida fusca]PZN63738.1 MAG: DUF3352 domain-containing protein [Thermobifida fusca]